MRREVIHTVLIALLASFGAEVHAKPAIAHEVSYFESTVRRVEEVKEQYREKRIITLANGTRWSNDNFLKAMAWRGAVYDDVLVTFIQGQLDLKRRLVIGRAYFDGDESQVFWEGGRFSVESGWSTTSQSIVSDRSLLKVGGDSYFDVVSGGGYSLGHSFGSQNAILSKDQKTLYVLEGHNSPKKVRVKFLGKSIMSPGGTCNDVTSLWEVSDDGEILSLLGGEVWRVVGGDSFKTTLWLPTTSLIVCGNQIINKNSGDRVRAKRIK